MPASNEKFKSNAVGWGCSRGIQPWQSPEFNHQHGRNAYANKNKIVFNICPCTQVLISGLSMKTKISDVQGFTSEPHPETLNLF